VWVPTLKNLSKHEREILVWGYLYIAVVSQVQVYTRFDDNYKYISILKMEGES
jgi:hypothetical protein